MAGRAATWLSIVVGGTGGALAALIGSNPPPPVPPPPGGLPLRPVGQLATELRPATPTAPSATPVPTSAGPTIPNASEAAAVASEPDAGSPAPAPSASAAPLPAAELLPLPTSKDKLLRAEMRCDQRKAESCIVAARSYETGSAGVTDLEKAAKYRRIALTAWISQCDHNSPAACATLASMYRAGSGVPQSERNAQALVSRARELCRFNDAPVCHDLPSP